MTGALALAVLVGALQSPPAPDLSPQEAFEALAADFVGFHLYFNPVLASELGASGFDDRLPDVGRSAIQARAEAYQAWLDRLHGVDQSSLFGDASADYVLLERAIRVQLLDLVEIRRWQGDPAYYVDVLDRGLLPLLRGGHTPARERMNDLTSRMRQAATLLAEARSNLNASPALFTARAADGADGLARVLRSEAESSFTEVASGPGKNDFLRATEQTATELDTFAAFLRTELPAGPPGAVSLGSERLGWLLQYREHAPDDPANLLDRLRSELEDEQVRFERAARALDANRRGAEVAAAAATRTLSPDEAAAVADTTMESARRFLFRTLFATVPSAEKPGFRVRSRHTPWARSGLRVPGPLATDDGPATLTILGPTPEAGPGAAHAAGLALLETFPGAFLGSLYARRGPTRLRKVLGSPRHRGAWGLYASATLLANGFEGPPEMRVGAHALRLQALAEAIAALQIHGQGMPLDDAEVQLARDALLTPAQAREAAARAAHRPLERGVLGSLQIQDLRGRFLNGDDGPSERRFHDALLSSGLPAALLDPELLENPQDQ